MRYFDLKKKVTHVRKTWPGVGMRRVENICKKVHPAMTSRAAAIIGGRNKGYQNDERLFRLQAAVGKALRRFVAENGLFKTVENGNKSYQFLRMAVCSVKVPENRYKKSIKQAKKTNRLTSGWAGSAASAR